MSEGQNARLTAAALVGLRGKALMLLTGAVVVVAALAWWVLSPWVAASFDNQVAQRGSVLASVLEEHQALRLALSLHNKQGATTVAEALLKGDEDLAYVILLDEKNKPLGLATREVMDEAQIAALIQQHRGGSIQSAEHESTDGVYRFTREVKRTDNASDDDLAILAGDVAPATDRALGAILLALSAKEARSTLASQTILTIGLTAVILMGVFFVFFSRIVARLRMMGDFAAKVAAGDLSTNLVDGRQDELGQLARSLEEMSARTGAVVGRLQDAAQALSLVSNEILSSSSQQTESATRQAASVAETGATVAELRETFNQASERAQSVIELARKSEESTTGGKESVEESVAAMEQIRDQVVTMSRTIQSLVERTAQIGTIIDAVNDLAEQSNVLALNAAIEAAKAGEHGRGFAVVAREVRTLAERSKDSTTQVRFILKDIEKATREAMGAIDEGTRKTEAGMALAHRAGDAIVHLDKAITESSTAARQIAASTRQQAVGVDQIWQAMRDIDRAVNESASGVRQLEGASRNMKDLSEQMHGLVSSYRVSREQTSKPAASNG